MFAKDEILVSTVLNKEGQDVCKVSIVQHMDIKNYDEIDVVFRSSLKETHVVNVGGIMAAFVYDNVELIDSNDGKYTFAFPFYGGAIIVLEFTGVEVSDYAYTMIQMNAAKAICVMIEIYYADRFKDTTMLEYALQKIAEMSIVVTNDITRLEQRVTEPILVAEIDTYRAKLKEYKE